MSKDEKNKSNDLDNLKIELWDRRLQKGEGSGLWFTQIKALLRKDFILMKRSWISSLMITIVTPLIAMLFLEYIIIINKNESKKRNVIHPDRIPLEGVPDCYGLEDEQDKCINLMFTNCIDNSTCTRDSDVDKIISIFVENNNKRMNLK